MNKVVAVVVTYNRKDLLRQCIDHLMAQRGTVPDILVIDNASTDGTAEMMMPLVRAGQIRYENTGDNLGGAGGFEYGTRVALRCGYEYVWLMDDDTLPRPDALDALIRAGGELGRFGYLSSVALWTDGELCRMNVQRDVRMHNIRDFSAEQIPSGAATFVSLLVPASVMREVGLPIGAFFIWADDLEYTRRISRRYPCYVVRDSVVVHCCATNNGGNISTDVPERIPRYRLAYRNEVYVYRREGMRGAVHLLLRTPLHIFRVLVRAKGEKSKRVCTILRGTIDGFSFKPPIPYPGQAEGGEL